MAVEAHPLTQSGPGPTQQSADLRALARTLCQESEELRALSRQLAFTAATLCGRVPPARCCPADSQLVAIPTILQIGGGAATEAVLRDYISETCLAPGDTGLEDDEPLLTNGILDSLGIMRLAAFIEETFGVNVPDDALVPEHFGSVRRVAALIERLEASDQALPRCPVVVGVGE
jgi:acyl carrier protein